MTNDVISALDISATEQLQAANIAETLHKHYPGHMWAVNIYQNVVYIYNLALSGDHAYVIHQDKMDNDGKMIIKAGGEILERYNLNRSRIKENQFMDLKRNFKGEIIRG